MHESTNYEALYCAAFGTFLITASEVGPFNLPCGLFPTPCLFVLFKLM